MSRHNLFIPDDIWLSIKEAVKRYNFDSISGYIRYLHKNVSRETLELKGSTHSKNTGKTLCCDVEKKVLNDAVDYLRLMRDEAEAEYNDPEGDYYKDVVKFNLVNEIDLIIGYLVGMVNPDRSNQQATAGSKVLPDPFKKSLTLERLDNTDPLGLVGRESNVGDVIEIAMPDGGVIQVPVSLVKELVPELFEKLKFHPFRETFIGDDDVEYCSDCLAPVSDGCDCGQSISYGNLTLKGPVFDLLRKDCDHEVIVFDEKLNADVCSNCGRMFYEKPKAMEDKAKKKAISNIKKDLDEIIGRRGKRGVRPYPKSKQLGKDRKKNKKEI